MRWLPDPRVAPHAQAIEERVGNFAAHIRPATFTEFMDPLMVRLAGDCFRDAGAHEGVFWLADREQKNLYCGYSQGPHADKLNSMKVPVDTGLSGMILATQQPFCENNLSQNRAAASSALESRLGVIVCCRVLVPFFIAGKMRGVLAAYKYKPTLDDPEPCSFDQEAVEELNLLSRLFGRLLDHKLLCAAIGLEED